MKKKYLYIILLFSFLTPQLIFAKEDSSLYLKKAETNLPHSCLFYFEMYLHAKEYKAFAYAIDDIEKVTCRFSASAKDQKKANSIALASCQKSAKEKGIESSCKLYDAGVKRSKTKKQLSFEEKYRTNLKEIRKTISKVDKKDAHKKRINPPRPSTDTTLPKKCYPFYKLYEDAKEHKAFAIAVDDHIKKYACKFSAGSRSKERAKEVALASCERAREKRGIKSSCQLFTLKAKTQSKREKADKEKAKSKEKKRGKSQTKQLIVKKEPKKSPKDAKPSLTRALKKAIRATNLKEIKRLIKQGADLNTVTTDKSTALFVTVAKGDITYAKELLKKGAYVFVKKDDGNNLLVAAIMSGSNEMLRLMLKQKIDPNIPCEEGNTPLHFAFMMFDDAMMKTLYRFKTRDDIKNSKGKTVRDLAKEFHIDLKRLKR